MLKYVIGAIVGGVLAYFVLYRLIGCSSGTCSITANPYISIIYGVILGVLIATMIPSSTKNDNSTQLTDPSSTSTSTETTHIAAIEYKKLTVEAAKARIDSGDEVIILDVRTAAEFSTGHIRGALLIPNETISTKMPDLLPELDAEILVYCRSGNRSAQAAKKLIKIGYTKVYDFGGIIDWPYETVTEP